MIKSKKNIQFGKINFLVILFYLVFINLILSNKQLEAKETLTGKFIEIKILDKISSKSNLLKIDIGIEK